MDIILSPYTNKKIRKIRRQHIRKYREKSFFDRPKRYSFYSEYGTLVEMLVLIDMANDLIKCQNKGCAIKIDYDEALILVYSKNRNKVIRSYSFTAWTRYIIKKNSKNEYYIDLNELNSTIENALKAMEKIANS